MQVVAKALGAELGGKGEVGLLVGARGNFVSDTRESGFTETIKKDYPNIKVVNTAPTDWDVNKARNATETWLTTYPNLSAVACISDSICLAAKTAAQARGKKIKIAAYDGDKEMHPFLNDGSMVIDVLTGAERVGYWNVAVGARLAKGAKLDHDLYMPTYFVTSAATAQRLAGAGLQIQSVTPEQAVGKGQGYQAEFGPSKPDSAMTVGKSGSGT
jgi:ribose transport system substrate-binding protein